MVLQLPFAVMATALTEQAGSSKSVTFAPVHEDGDEVQPHDPHERTSMTLPGS
jgi:hypothetical protein